MRFDTLGDIRTEAQVMLLAMKAARKMDQVYRSDDVTVSTMIEEAH
jgi:hypothetical protein